MLRIDALSLLFPDGEVYRAPESDVLPPQVGLGRTPPDHPVVTFHAALPALRTAWRQLRHRDRDAPDDAMRRLFRSRPTHETQDLFTAPPPRPRSRI